MTDGQSSDLKKMALDAAKSVVEAPNEIDRVVVLSRAGLADPMAFLIVDEKRAKNHQRYVGNDLVATALLGLQALSVRGSNTVEIEGSVVAYICCSHLDKNISSEEDYLIVGLSSDEKGKETVTDAMNANIAAWQQILNYVLTITGHADGN